MKKFLVCRPTHFNVNYSINPWMNNQIGNVNNNLAMQQWENFTQQLEKNNCKLVIIEDYPANLPDLVFTANAAIINYRNGIALMSNFKYPDRRPETSIYADFLAKSNYYPLKFLPEDVYFEGAGDVLIYANSVIFMGHGFRTMKSASAQIRQWMDMQVISLELIDDRFYHLDTCFCPLVSPIPGMCGLVMYYPGAFSEMAQIKINEIFSPLTQINVSLEDALDFACNAVQVDDKIFLNKASDKLKAKLDNLGFIVIETPLTEFMKAGGSAKCLTLEI